MILSRLAIVFCVSRLALAGTPAVQGFWRLGDTDPNAVIGQPAGTTTLDSSGAANNLTLVGSPAPTYVQGAPKNSLTAMSFNGLSNYSGNAVNSGTNNFGIEVWAFPTSSGGRVVIYNGNTSNAGYGIYQVGSSWGVLYGGVNLSAVAPLVLNQWTDLALVRDGGTTTLYVNGVAFNVATPAPNPVAGNILIGANQSGTERFVGVLDEGRVFTFTGGFNPADLLINQPPPPVLPGTPAPSTLILALIGFLLTGLYMARRKFALR